MPEPRRVESRSTSDAAADRDGRAEALLIDGLDCYFNNRYDEAIHLWTRVLFLDRSHARARAYIDRARTALAERQRRSEEMLQASQDLLERGDTDAARGLLTEAVAATGDDERASALRMRLERLERAHAGARTGRISVQPAPEAVPGWTRPRPWRGVAVTGAALALALLLILGVTSPAVGNWMGFGSTNEVLVVTAAQSALPVLSSSDAALVRARNLYGKGRLAEALKALDRVGPDNAVRTEADRLRVEIQRLLLASAPESSRSPARPGSPRQ